jgi:8-oxo-dGTP diphosphatase
MKEIVCDSHSVAVDVVIFTVIAEELNVLLIKRAVAPKDIWAIPGGFVLKNESLDVAAIRELKEETGVEKVYLEQLYTFGDPKRDPRGRVISIAFFALVNAAAVNLKSGSDAKEVAWHKLSALPKLAFDHTEIVKYAKKRLIWKLEYTNLAFGLLPKRFSLTDLQKTYEAVLGKSLDKRNFRKKFLTTGLIKATEAKEIGAHRPATLYEFTKQRLEYIKNPFGQFLGK